MTKGQLFQQLADVPDNFELCLTKYMIVKHATIEGKVEEVAVVKDDSIIALAVSHETQQIRFVRDRSNLKLAEDVGDKPILLP